MESTGLQQIEEADVQAELRQSKFVGDSKKITPREGENEMMPFSQDDQE
eukprot:CAMPEP_0176360872 /NCGR_PEP_ID=MMETSP0126-20121128/17358_1 /TAXON_ID=141414 ORGANISM="Strombidinopsis acuminatum, Strain SPMC142" /NCGR_SAMPLE_ID=MMETSP0126 /ASSEMBLY_ACC=CAM_ASM_000229 /LENGTH=48 /DNA_ID= /DNA_START= /DNA_END= /DNA_ORIENTATION=